MTKINRLTQLTTLEDSDLSVVWQDSSERTRAITIANLRNFIQSTDPNADAFVKAELIGDELVLTSHDEIETRIDINILPEHSVTELKDMPDNLLSGQYLKVSDDGTGFVLTPSSETSTDILIQSNDEPAVDVNVLKFTDGVEIAIENKIATIKTGLLLDDQFITKIYTESDLSVLIEDEVATISINNQVSPWPIQDVGIGDSPKVIDKVEDLGIEYQFEASSTFTQSVHLYHVGLPEGAQIKVTVTNVEPNSKPIDVFQLSAGSDLRWPVITPTVFTLRSGLWRVEESSQLLHVADATTFDDDAARKKIVHGVAVEPNSSITMDVNDDGVLVVGGGGDGDSPIFKSLTIEPDQPGDSFTAKRLDGTDLMKVLTTEDENVLTYEKTLLEYGESLIPNEVVNAAYVASKCVLRNGGWVAGDLVALPYSAYVMGLDAYFATENLYIQSNTKLLTGSAVYTPGPDGGWEGEVNEYGRLLKDSIEFDKAHVKNLTVDNLSATNSDFIRKHTNAELNKLFCAYQGKYGDNRAFYPVSLYQDVNGWSQAEFTGNMLFKYKSKDTGTIGDKVFELRPGRVVTHKDLEILGETIYDGDTSQPTNLINRKALDDEPQKEWFSVANGTLATDGNRPSGGSGVEGELAVWHNVTSESTTDPANELKIAFDGAYEKVDNFSKPLRFKLSQQGGARNQYWTVDNNGWQTEGNVWHLSASKVSGDNLVVGIDTKVYASSYFLEEGGGSNYQGEGLGVPEGAFLVTGTINQSKPVGLYYNALNDGSSRGNIELNNDDGYNEFQVIIQGLAKPTREWRIGTGTPGRYSDKTIRPSETWLCRVYVDWNASSNTNFFWTRLDDGTSSFDAIDTSSFDSGAKVEVLKKTFESKDLVSIPIELPEGFEILVSSVICKIDGRLKKQPFEYQYENGVLRVHLNEVCSGIIIAELIK